MSKARRHQGQVSPDDLALLIEAVEDYAIYMLDPDGRILTWNRGAGRTKGWSSEEILGCHFSVFYPEEDRRAGKPARELAAARRLGRLEDEGWRVRKDGTRFWANVVVTALYDQEGRLKGFAKVTRDITQHKRMMDGIEAAERAKTDFLNLAAHELRGPLTALAGYLSLLSEGGLGELPAPARGLIPTLEGRVADMNRLVSQMLEVARIEGGGVRLDRQPVDLRTVARDAADRARPLLTPRHSLTFEEPETALVASVDRERVGTILGNLLSNAIKYSPAGGVVRLAVSGADGVAQLAVTDQGVGIAPADLPRLFGRFARLSAADVPGIGLGLYLSRGLARLHGGDLVAESEPDRGSTFTLRLPLDQP